MPYEDPSSVVAARAMLTNAGAPASAVNIATSGASAINIPSSVKGALPDNTNYQVTIQQQTTGITVMANCPASFDFQLTSHWVPLSTWLGGAGSIGSAVAGVIGMAQNSLALAGAAFGGVSRNRITDIMVWDDNESIEFTLPLVFKAVKSAKDEVVAPIADLIRIISPGDAGANFLSPPGPSIKDSFSAIGTLSPANSVVVKIGKNTVLLGLIMTSLHGKWENRFTYEGWPIAAEAQITFRVFTTLTRDEIVKAFFGGATFGR